MADRVVLAAVAGAFGVGGEVRLKPFTVEPEAVGSYGALHAEDGRRFEVTGLRPIKGGLAARLSGVATREEAEALRGVRLSVPRERLPALQEDEFYHADLIGLPVSDPGGVEIGRVKAVLDFGAGDILELHLPGGGTALLPFTRDTVPTVDLAAGRLVADPPEGWP